MPYYLYLFLGILPSFVWLLIYLRKDAHPESKVMILKIFIYGMLITLPIISFTLMVEIFGFTEIISKFISSSIYIKILYIFLWGALMEELLKYLVVKKKVLNHSEFDEPVDVMIYMIIAALGFVAVENILLFSRPETFSLYYSQGFIPEYIERVTIIVGLRFLTATFLHALCSGVLGYFLALSLFETKKRKRFLFAGLGLAVLLHGLYNLFIMELGKTIFWLIPIIILLFGLALFVGFAFKRLKKIKSICKIN